MSNNREFSKIYADKVEREMKAGWAEATGRSQVWAILSLTGGLMEIGSAINRLAGAVEKIEEGQRSDRLSR